MKPLDVILISLQHFIIVKQPPKLEIKEICVYAPFQVIVYSMIDIFI